MLGNLAEQARLYSSNVPGAARRTVREGLNNIVIPVKAGIQRL
jgi:hypothetical protein